MIFKLKLKVYSYWLNNRSSEQFYGPIIGRWGEIKDKCLNHIRSTEHQKTNTEAGWHFTSLGGYEGVKKKQEDSYTQETYASPYVLDNLYTNINELHDFLGRDFNYYKDDSNWPRYLKDNKSKYGHLLI